MNTLLHDVISVEPLGVHRVRVRSDDGVDGVVDVERVVRLSGVFEELRESSFFAQVKVHPELGVVYWPNGADLDSDACTPSSRGESILPMEPSSRRQAQRSHIGQNTFVAFDFFEALGGRQRAEHREPACV